MHGLPNLNNWEECGPCPVFASYTLAFALQLRKKALIIMSNKVSSSREISQKVMLFRK